MARRFQGIFRCILLLSPPSAPCCLGACDCSQWRQHGHFRGLPPTLARSGQWRAHARRLAALAGWPGPLAASSDSSRPSRGSAPRRAALPSASSKDSQGRRIQRWDHCQELHVHLSHLGNLGYLALRNQCSRHTQGGTSPCILRLFCLASMLIPRYARTQTRGGQGRGAEVAVLTLFSEEKCNLAKRSKGFVRVQEVKQM